MEETIKLILSEFLRTAPEKITTSTVIDKSAVKGSIIVHRMYGALANAGVKINDYLTIKTYGELLSKVSINSFKEPQIATMPPYSDEAEEGASTIGIDIESVINMPICPDFREDQFYKMTFTDQEISYCSIQENPLRSFTGLFAAKEAIIKANNIYKGIPFSQIEITHDMQGKPFKKGLQISISHVNDFSVAVAIQERPPVVKKEVDKKLEEANTLLRQQNNQLNNRLKFYLAIIFCLILLFIYKLVLR